VKRERSCEQVSFRALLAAACQKEFAKQRSDEKERSKEIEEIRASAKHEDSKRVLNEQHDVVSSEILRRSLGTVQFIGELYKVQMLTESIMLHCLWLLLNNNEDDSLECLCCLLKTIGNVIDLGSTKVSGTEITDWALCSYDNCAVSRMSSQ